MAKVRRAKLTNTRRGPFSNKEKQQLADFAGVRSIDEIALILNRPVKQVKAYLDTVEVPEEGQIRRSEDDELRIELHSQADWKMIQKEYMPEDLVYYEVEYLSYRKQLSDLNKTEIKQLHQLISLDIKIHHHQEDLRRDNKDIDRMDKLLKNLIEDNGGDHLNKNNPNTMLIMELEVQIQACRTAKNARTKEYKDLSDKYSNILKDLKSTRDQRIKSVEDKGKFIDLLKSLEVQSRRNAISEIVGLMDISIEQEKKRLGSLSKFSDGLIDRALLTPESIEQEEEVLFEG